MPVGRSSVVMCDDSVCKVGSMNLVALCGISICAGQHNGVQGVLANRLHCHWQSLSLYLYLFYWMLCEVDGACTCNMQFVSKKLEYLSHVNALFVNVLHVSPLYV